MNDMTSPAARRAGSLRLVLLTSVLLYAAFILWPAYTSGLATFTGSPKLEWDRPVPLWYAPAADPSFTPWSVPLLAFVLGLGFFAPLVIGVASVLLFSVSLSQWLALTRAARVRALAVSFGSWALLAITYVASSQFMRWVID